MIAWIASATQFIDTVCLCQIIVYRSRHFCRVAYSGPVPKLWNETIDSHRRAVREAILDTAGAMATGQGLSSVTMSEIALGAGIGRATLYKYFPDVDAILVAWHERQITTHLKYLAEIRSQAGYSSERLKLVLEAYALIAHQHHGTELSAILHQGQHVVRAQEQLNSFIEDILTQGAEAGDIRKDIAPAELASYCLHALTAAGSLPSKAAVLRLVKVTLAGLRAHS